MNDILNLSENVNDMSGMFSRLDVFIVLILSFLLSLIIGFIYRSTHKGVSYSQSYVQTLVIMGTVVAFIMLIIGSNVARAFALVGALSVVRFRNAMKETRDIGFIFMVMGIGMSVGTRFYFLAIVSTVMFSIYILSLSYFDVFAKNIQEKILRIRLPMDIDYEEAFVDVFEQYLKEFRIISVETVRSGVLQEVVYSIVLKKGASNQKLIEAIRERNGNSKVTLVLGQQEIDL